MGNFRVALEIGKLTGQRFQRVNALVDKGFGLAADPVNRRLIPVPGLLKLRLSA